MAEVEMNELMKLFDKAYSVHLPICLIGRYSMGKSQVVYEWAENKAKEENRELRIWYTLTEKEKREIFESPEKYFVLVDIKLQTIGDPTKLTGLPLSKTTKRGGEAVVWEIPMFFKVLSQKNSKGVLFLDEFNMAPPAFQNVFSEIILQKKVGEWKMNDDIFIVVAADLPSGSSEVPQISPHLINRMLLINYDKYISVDEWLNWAINNGIDSRIIAFVKTFKKEFVRFPSSSEETMLPSTTPRSWEMLSKFIKGEEDLEVIRMGAEALLHPTTAQKFIEFVKLQPKL
jgi:MoxR-like ATPase